MSKNGNFLRVALLMAGIAYSPIVLAEDADAVVAVIAGQEIHESDIQMGVANLDPQLAKLPDDQKRVAALSAAIDVKVISAIADKEGLGDSDDFKKRMQFLREHELHNAYFRANIMGAVSDEDVKARYEKEIAAVEPQEEVHARHILVKTEEEAKAVIAELDSGKDFIELAKEKSTGPSGPDGGDLGFFGKGRMVPEFEAAAFALEAGSYTKEPVKTQFGFHVIKVEEKRIAPPPPFEQVEQQIRQLVVRDLYIKALTEAKAGTSIEIKDEALKAGYEEVNKAQQ